MPASVALALLPAHHRRASAFRRFPPGCGRHHNASAGPPPHHPFPTTAAAAAAKTKPSFPNRSTARGATKTAPLPPRPTIHAAASLGTEAPERGVGNGRKAAAAVTVRRASALRRYPPGCGRGAAVYEPQAWVGKAESDSGASKPSAVVGNGDSKARACDREVMLRASALDHAEFNSNSNGRMTNGGDDDADAQEEGGGKPWLVTGHMAVPFLPWAQYGRRSHRPSY